MDDVGDDEWCCTMIMVTMMVMMVTVIVMEMVGIADDVYLYPWNIW